MVLVLDTSALFAMEDLPEDALCPPGVVDELRRHKDGRLDLWGDLLRVSDCTKASEDRVREAAKRSGDLGRLSPVDISVIALALDVDGIVLSDDYSIENVCAIMGIEYRPVGTSGIKKVERWNYRCLGCGRWYKEKMDDCPVCGSGMRAHRKR